MNSKIKRHTRKKTLKQAPHRKIAADVQDWVYEQLHAGDYKGSKVWHTTTDGRWWSGHMFSDRFSLTPRQLLRMVRSIESDILELYPNLK